jgi:hypothetical protein
VNHDRLRPLQTSVERPQPLRTVQTHPSMRSTEGAPSAKVVRVKTARTSLWQVSVRAIPTVAALVSTSLLVYFVLIERSQPYAQLQQPPQQEAQRQLAQNGPRPSTPDQAKPQPRTSAAPAASVPSDDVLLMLIRSTLIALNQANATGNYTVLREMGAPGLQKANSAARLAEAFANLRHRNLDLSPILLFQPKLYRKPEITSRGMLRVTGFFPTEPERVKFDLLFQLIEGRWRPFGISADTSRVQPTPQATPSPTREAPAESVPQASKPVAPAPQSPEKPKAGEGENIAKPQVDIRDRIETIPEEPAGKSTPEPKSNDFNPFGH